MLSSSIIYRGGERLKGMKKIILGITYTMLLFFVFFRINDIWSLITALVGILSPFLFGGALAFVLSIPMNFYERNIFKRAQNKKLLAVKRPVCLLLTFLSFLGVVFFVVFLVAPELVTTIKKIADTIPPFVAKVQEWIESLSIDWNLLQDYINQAELDWQKISSSAMGVLQTFLEGFFSSAVSVVVGVVKSLVNLVISIIFSAYLLVSKEKLGGQMKRLFYAFLPKNVVRKTMEIFRLSHRTFRNFLTGQCLEAIILGSMFFVTMVVLQLPYALLISVLIAVTALIPIFGAFIACFVGALLIVMVDPWQALFFIILFLILQQIESNFVYPHVVGNSVGLPSIWVFVSVTLGGSLMGIAGMFLFIPIVSVVYSVLRQVVNRKIRKKQSQRVRLQKKGLSFVKIKWGNK